MGDMVDRVSRWWMLWHTFSDVAYDTCSYQKQTRVARCDGNYFEVCTTVNAILISTKSQTACITYELGELSPMGMGLVEFDQCGWGWMRFTRYYLELA